MDRHSGNFEIFFFANTFWWSKSVKWKHWLIVPTTLLEFIYQQPIHQKFRLQYFKLSIILEAWISWLFFAVSSQQRRGLRCKKLNAILIWYKFNIYFQQYKLDTQFELWNIKIIFKLVRLMRTHHFQQEMQT